MSDISPTRSAVIEMKDERRAMHEGHVFLDEKCLLLAGEMLRQLQEHARLKAAFDARHRVAHRNFKRPLGLPANAGPEGFELAALAPGLLLWADSTGTRRFA